VPTLAVLTAAGSGTRLGLGRPKALVEVDGTALVVHAARRLTASGVVDSLVVTAPPALVAAIEDLLRAAGLDLPWRVVAGGATRQASVAAGLAAAGPGDDTVLVHDAARPLAPPSLAARVHAAVRAGYAAVVPGLPVTDTVKQVAAPSDSDDGDDDARRVTATVDRALLRAVQTPQGFERALLERAHAAAVARAGDESTAASDDAGLVEALGEDVWVVAGDPLALKITTVHDLAVAGLLLEESS
jgi:2-C-methyl-D-erythritol 4-phosphate cytidylyltransferase